VSGGSSDDVSAGARFVGVCRNRFIGFEVQVAFDRKPEFVSYGAKFSETDVAEFGAAHSEIAEAEGEVGAFVDFGEEPGALGIGGEKFHDGIEVDRLILSVDGGATLHELTQIRIVTATGFWHLFLQLGTGRWRRWGVGRWRRRGTF
jgi:hypothetical protein